MSIFVIGINHKTAPLSLREKIYFPLEKLSLYLQDLLNRALATEAVLLSTCNRSELYGDANDVNAIRDWFCGQTTVPRDSLEKVLYTYQDNVAIAHIMQVACGLDSMVLGEPQILGQMKEAFSESCTVSAVGASFHRLFQQVFNVAKEIRTTTAIGACPVSVASAAIHFAKEKIADIQDRQVVVIGAGETAHLLLRYLQPLVGHSLVLINRSLENATALIEEFPCIVHGLDQLPQVLSQADIVFSATGSATPIIGKEMMQQVIATCPERKIMLVDIAVPRNIEANVAELENVKLYCIDDLKTIIENNRKGREHGAQKAHEMIIKKSMDCFAEINSLDKVAYTIRTYRGQIEAMCRIELSKAKHRLQQGDNPDEVLDAFAHAFTKKLLHQPSVQLRQAGAEGRFEFLKFANQLFAISEPEIELI